MPVQWAYVLSDGTVAYLGEDGRFLWNSHSEANPIVGRYAFWVDDLSCRININTAAEGAYWETPRVNTVEDRSYARFPPANGEYQVTPVTRRRLVSARFSTRVCATTCREPLVLLPRSRSTRCAKSGARAQASILIIYGLRSSR